MTRIAPVASLLALVLMPSACVWGEPRVDPQTGLIRVLFMGDSLMQAGFVTPIIVQDPLVKLSPVPVEFITGAYLSIEEAAAKLRMYLPRTEKRMNEDFDMMIIADAREPFFPGRFQNWIRAAVIDGGQGFLMAGGPQSFGGLPAWEHPSWDPSPVADILPCKCIADYRDLGSAYHVVPATGYEDHPLVRKIPWSQVFLFNQQRVGDREGSVVVGRSDRNPPSSPVIMYMEMGKGRTEAFVFDWGGNGPQDFHRWNYAPLVLSNLVYHAVRVSIPEDTSLFLELRRKLTGLYSSRSFTMSVLDFAEKFGANLNKAEAELKKSEDLRKEMIKLYVHGDYDSSLSTLDEALSSIKVAADLAIDAKDQALVWVYVIEWFTVSGTAMFSGAVLWTLMVKKAAYKPVASTRFNI